LATSNYATFYRFALFAMTALRIQSGSSVSSLILASKCSTRQLQRHHFLFPWSLNVSSLNTIQITISGESPLLLHNGQTADPRNTYSKAIKAVSSKRKKTDADYDEMARLEWLAGLYRFRNELVIPDYVLEATFVNGAKKSKRGPQAKCGLFFTEHAILDFVGKPSEINDQTLADMFDGNNFTHTAGVKVGTAKVMRTRPIFRDWNLKAIAQFDPDVLNLRDIEEIAVDAGKLVGIGDSRPKHGRFSAHVTPVSQVLDRMLAQVG
jgi:hypothetical protein